MIDINQKIEVPLPKGKRVFIYIQGHGRYVNLNLYYYDKIPYDDSVDSTSSVFSFQLRFRV